MRHLFFIVFITAYCLCQSQEIKPGAYQLAEYLEDLKGKNVAVACNHSSMIRDKHLIDVLVSKGISIKRIFAPEHGFRGKADAGAHVKSGIDIKTGISIISLYGSNKKPSKEDLDGIDVIVFDIQDVGTRFYTYISTLQYIMEACADNGVLILVLDRPNPNGHYVDGPILDEKHKSFVGMQSIPIVYGMTIGEYACMLKGENWLSSEISPNLRVIKCLNYSHSSIVNLEIPPSPNLKSGQAIALYPSLCLFEGTNVSVGRGTKTPFEMFGSPYLTKSKFDYSFTPVSMKGAKYPPFKNVKCYGKNLSAEQVKNQFDLSYLLEAYSSYESAKKPFFLNNKFFDKLAGNSTLRWQIIKGKSEKEIRASWEPALSNFKEIRKKYLLYPE